MIIAVTGPREVRHPLVMKSIIQETLKELEGVTEFRTGAQYGVDTAAYFLGLAEFPNAQHVVMYPEGERFNELVLRDAVDREDIRVVAVRGGYLKRNDALIYGYSELSIRSDLLLGFPASTKEILRSGTWAAIRGARKAGVRVSLNPLS